MVRLFPPWLSMVNCICNTKICYVAYISLANVYYIYACVWRVFKWNPPSYAEGRRGTVVPDVEQGDFCGGRSSAGISKECLLQIPREILLTASIRSIAQNNPRMALIWITFACIFMCIYMYFIFCIIQYLLTVQIELISNQMAFPLCVHFVQWTFRELSSCLSFCYIWGWFLSPTIVNVLLSHSPPPRIAVPWPSVGTLLM